MVPWLSHTNSSGKQRVPMKKQRRWLAVVTGVITAIAIDVSRADEPAAETVGFLPLCDAAALAERIYEPEATDLPRGLTQQKTIDVAVSGLYAEFYVQDNSDTGTPRSHLVVAIRGVEFSKLLKDYAAFSADVRAAAAGGMPQWRDLEAPLLDTLEECHTDRLTLVGHSMGGMISQLAAGYLIQVKPELQITVMMFNSPGVSALVRAENTDAPAAGGTNLQLIHLVHQADPIPRIKMFGEHLKGTRWYLVNEASTTPHGVQNFLAYADAHGGSLPARMTPEAIRQYLVPPTTGEVAVAKTDALVASP